MPRGVKQEGRSPQGVVNNASPPRIPPTPDGGLKVERTLNEVPSQQRDVHWATKFCVEELDHLREISLAQGMGLEAATDATNRSRMVARGTEVSIDAEMVPPEKS